MRLLQRRLPKTILKTTPKPKEPRNKRTYGRVFKKLDNKLNTEECQETVLGGKKNKYTYPSIVRTTLGENGEAKPDKHPYIKLKLLTEYPGTAITTTVIEQCDDGTRFLKTDTQSLSDFEKYFRLRGSLKCIIVPVKIWIHQTNATEAQYGLTFKLIKVLVKMPLESFLEANSPENEIDFLDSDSD